MTMNDKLELALDIARRRGLPAHQNEHAETLISQLLTFALDACVVADASVDQKDGVCVMPSGGVKAVNECIANLLLAVALDVCHIFGNAITEKGKEEGKEKIPPHPPIEKGPEESEKDDTPRARARKGDCKHRSDEEVAFDIFFETGFWPEYPRKVGKKASRDKLFAKFKAAKNKGAFCEKVANGVLKWRKSPQWHGPSRFIPYPLTWINQERWDDEGVEEISYAPQKPLRGVSQTANVKANRGCQW